MAYATATVSSVTETVQEFADNEVKREAKSALEELDKETSGFWAGVERFINWLRTKVRTAVQCQKQQIDFLLKWVLANLASAVGRASVYLI